MKQQITLEQIKELSPKAKIRLRKFFFGHAIEPRLLSIGELIQFLGEHKIHNFHPIDRCEEAPGKNGWHVDVEFEDGFLTFDEEELCDALWEAVKKILEQ